MVNERKIRLLGPNEIRQLAEELDLNPTKKLGQNFVHDPNTVRKIVKAADVSAAIAALAGKQVARISRQPPRGGRR